MEDGSAQWVDQRNKDSAGSLRRKSPLQKL